jgi:hypothetical protein
MSDTEVIPGYTTPTFTSEGFQDESYEAPLDVESTDTPTPFESATNTKKDRRKRHSSTRRVENLLYERGNLEQQNTFLAQQAQEKDDIIAAQQQQLQSFYTELQKKEEEGSQYLETAFDIREEALLKEIKRAKEEADIDAEIQLISELTDIKAKKNTYQYQQSQKQQQQVEAAKYINEEPYVPIETYMPPAPASAPVDEAYLDWLEDNSWYEHNPRLRKEADQYAQELADTLSFNNQAHMIGTAEFRDSITNIMRSHYGIGDNTQMSESPQQAQQHYDYGNYSAQRDIVAPVTQITQRGGNMANNYIQNRNTPLRPLTKEEYAIARHLPRKGNESEADVVRAYAEAKNYPKSPLPGGSPYRLTFF